MKRRPMQRREKLLVIAAVAAGLAGGYGILRVGGKEAEIAAFREELARLQQEAAARPPRPAGGDLEEARAALDAAKQSLARVRTELAAQTERMVNAGSANAVEAAMLEVTELAAQTGVELQRAENFTGQMPGFPAAAARPGTGSRPLSARPLRKLALSGSYPSLTAFMDALHNLRHSVTVLGFSLRLAEGKPAATNESPKLAAELVLML